jgi:hypothetical protein
MPKSQVESYIEHQDKSQGGKLAYIESPISNFGPKVEVSIQMSKAFSEELLKEKKEIPRPIVGMAVIDTGSSISGINQETIEHLQLQVIDVRKVRAATEKPKYRKFYAATFHIHMDNKIEIPLERVVGIPLEDQGIIALIGRDILKNFTFIYDGKNRLYSLTAHNES